MPDFEIGEKRCLLSDRPADFAFQPQALPVRLYRREGIAGVENGIAVVGLNLAVEVLAAGFGKHLHPAHPDAVVFGGERVLIDANFPNRRFGGKAAPGETVNVNLAAIRTSGRTCQS